MHLPWIQVAGTGSIDLPSSVYWCAEAIGKQLAAGRYGLVTGGWQGVDHVVARAFAEELIRRGENVFERLLQVVKEGSFPDYRGGRAAYFKEYFDGYTASLQRSDAVVLLGGVGGSYDLGSLALQHGLPVFPIAGTGGDALRFYEKVRDSPQMPVGLQDLSRPIRSQADAEALAASLEILLKDNLRARQERNRIFLSYSRHDCVWLNLFKLVLGEYLPEQRFLIWDDTQIEASERFPDTIRHALESAKLAVLLVSRKFCESTFIQQTELPALRQAVTEGRLQLFWMRIDDCDFELASEIQALHATYLPLSAMRDAEQQLAALHTMSRTLQQAFSPGRA